MTKNRLDTIREKKTKSFAKVREKSARMNDGSGSKIDDSQLLAATYINE